MASESGTISFVPGAELLARVEAYRDRLAKERPGSRVTTSDALRQLLIEGLERVEEVQR